MLARLHTIQLNQENGNEDLTAIANGLRHCIGKFHQLFDSFLKLSGNAVTIPLLLLQRVTQAIFLLVTIEKAINSLDEKRQLIPVEELQTQLYLDRVVSLLGQITTRHPSRSISGVGGLLTLLQHWMRQQSTGKLSIKRSDVRIALKTVLAEDNVAMEHLGGFLELVENSVRDQEHEG